MTNVKNAKKYNDTLFKIFADAKINNERNDFIRFYEANTHLTLDEAVEMFRAMDNIPY